MNLHIQVTLGKSVQSIVHISQEKDCWLIGSSEDADVILSGDRIMPIHAKLLLDEDQWTLVAAQGTIKQAGDIIDSIEIYQTLTISIGPYLLKISKDESVSSNTQEEHELEQSDSGLEIEHPRILANRFETASKLKQLFKRQAPSDQKRANSPVVKSPSITKRRALLIGLLVITWGFVALRSCGVDTQEPQQVVSEETKSESTDIDPEPTQADETEEDKAISLDEKRTAERYIQWADQLYDEGQLEQAYLRLQAGYQKIPNHIELKASLEKLRDELIDNYRTTRQFNKALDLLEPIKTQNQSYSILYDQLRVEQDLSDNMRLRAASTMQALDDLSDEYQHLLNENKFAQAKQLLSDLDINVLNSDTALMQKYNSLIQAVEHRREIYAAKRAEQQQAQQSALLASQLAFSECMDYTKSGDYKSAYLSCKKVEETASENFDLSEVTMWLAYLDEKRFADSRALMKQAENCFSQGDFNCAFTQWQGVLDIDPENSQVSEQLNQAIEQQVLVAQRLYKTAKAYEDLGQIRQAKVELEKLMQQLPLENQPLYQKASKLMDSLEQY